MAEDRRGPSRALALASPRTRSSLRGSLASIGLLLLLVLPAPAVLGAAPSSHASSSVPGPGPTAPSYSPGRASTSAKGSSPDAPSTSGPSPDETGPVHRSLVLYNNSLESGTGNATNFVGAYQAATNATGGTVYLASPPSDAVEEVNVTTLQALWALPIPSGVSGAAYDPADGMLWVADGSSGNLTEVDVANRSIVWHAPVNGATGSTLASATYDPALSSLLLTDEQTDQLLFFDPTTRVVTSTAGVDSGPISAVVDPASGDILVVDQLANNVTVVSGSTLLPVSNIAVGFGPVSATYIPSLSEMAVANGGSQNVTLIDASSWTVVGELGAGLTPEGIGYDRDSGDLYVANYGSANVSILDPATRSNVGELLGVDEPYALLFDGNAHVHDVVFSSARTNNLTVVNGTTGKALGSIPLGSNPADVVMDTTNSLLYVANSEPGAVVVVNPYSFRTQAWIPVGANPTAITFNPDTHEDQVYVADSGFASQAFAGNVSVIDATTNTVVTTLRTYNQPNDIAFDPQDQLVYVSDGGGPGNGFVGEISVFYASNDSYPSSHHDLNITSGLCLEPDGLAYDPVTQDLLVGCERGSGGVDVVNTTTDSVVNWIGVGGPTSNERYDPFDGSVWVTGITQDDIFQLNATTYATVNTVSTGIGVPTDVDIDTNNGYVAVAVEAANQVYLIDANDSRVLHIQVGAGPDAIGFDPVQGNFYVGNGLGGTVSELPILTVEFFRANPATITFGNATNLIVYAPDGNATSEESFVYVPPAGCTTHNTSMLRCAPSAAGTYPVTVEVIDQYGKTDNASTTITVNPAPLASLTVAPDPTGVGKTVTFTATVTLGTPPYTYSYAGLPSGCTSANTATLSCTPSASGNFTVVLSAEDSDEVTVTAAADLTVNPGPSILSFTALPTEVVEGRTTVLTVSAKGGTGTLSYAYTGLPTGCFTADAPTLTCSPPVTGPWTVLVVVTDSAGRSAEANVSLLVVGPLKATISATPNPVAFGQNTTLTTVATGGGGGLTFLYTGLPSGCESVNSSSIDCVASSAGTFEVVVTVFDHLDETVHAFVNLTVQSSPASSSFDELLILGAAAAVVIFGAIGVLMFLRKRKKAEPPPPPEPAYGATAAGAYAPGGMPPMEEQPVYEPVAPGPPPGPPQGPRPYR